MADKIWGLLGNFKGALRFASKNVKIENNVFNLFSKVTSSVLFLAAGLVTLSTLIGDSIQCITPPKEDITQPKAINQYCWIMSTYTLPHLYNKTITTEVIAMGVGPGNPEADEQKYHSYYQWVPFVLFFQGMLFMVPHHLWKIWEDGRIKAYSFLELTSAAKLRDRTLEVNHDQAKKGIRQGAEYFKACMYFNHFYSGYYIICEILNFIIVVSTIFMTDSFLGNEFTTYGTEVINFVNSDPETRIDPMDRVFPKITKCDFRKIGPSGNIIHYDVLCVLALNILNEKIYVFLWFWYIILAIIGGLDLIYRLLVVLLPGLRQRLILRRIPRDIRDNCRRFLGRLGYSDWFLLKRISCNINTIRFGELCVAIHDSLEEDERGHEPSIRSSDRSPSSLTSPPPTYDSSTIPIKDDFEKDRDDEKKGSELFARHYPSFSLDDFGKDETEPLKTSRL